MIIVRPHFAWVFSLLFTGGCAFVDLHVAPPSENPVPAGTMLGRGREIILEAPLADERPFRQRCGMQKNGYNMDTANVYCTVAPSESIAHMLHQGLVNAGFRVSRTPTNHNPSAVHIQGTLLQFFVEPAVGIVTVTPEADIYVKLVATSDSGLRAERYFYVKGTDESLVATEENFQYASDDANREIVQAMVKAIAQLMDRYPQLGSPAAPGGAPVSPQPASEKSP
jgi:hypothetical protein